MSSAQLPARTRKPRERRKPIVLPPKAGRVYRMGRMTSTFKADNAETGLAYSISEWWLAPNTAGPGTHSHPEDHVYYIIAGTMNVQLRNRWIAAPRGTFILIPGGVRHNFENRGTRRAGMLNFNSPGGFEDELPGITAWFARTPLGKAR